MPLKKYNTKRDFSQTAEPRGIKKTGGRKLHFVVQRHDATRLHYDFRLEMAGVLKSWAVPKGPSLNPADKRLAVMVEDHPYAYRKFEGTIPKGNYGAGNVEIWDEGTYTALEQQPGKNDEAVLLQELKNGSLKFVLHGKKLNGEFALVRMKNATEDNAWLLIKHKDAFAVNGAYDAERSPRKQAARTVKASSNIPAPKTTSTTRAARKKKATPLPVSTEKNTAII